MDITEPVSVANLEDAHERMYDLGWTDGLPVIPPTTNLVNAVLEYLGRDPQEIIGIVPPKNRIASIEKIAVNCVMAGCKPHHVPVVIAALEGLLEDSFNLNGVQATTNCVAPLTIVSGPIVDELDFNYGDNVFGGGSRSSAVVGRAVRLILWNLGGGYPGEIDRATIGHPGKYTFCIAEDPHNNPWESIHEEMGFTKDASCASVFACEAPHHIATGSGYIRSATDILKVIADSTATAGSSTMNGGGQILLVIGPMTAQKLTSEGYNKDLIRKELAQLAVKPVGLMKSCQFLNPGHPFHWASVVDANDDRAMVPALREPEKLLITVAGGWGSGSGFCAVTHGWMEAGGHLQTKAIVKP